ncbi:hypothetical protein RFI_21795, partial [Reticulomyxa filosa]
MEAQFNFSLTPSIFYLTSSKIIFQKKERTDELKLINKVVFKLSLDSSLFFSKEEEIQVIIQHWVRILKIKLGWIKDFDKIIVNYVILIIRHLVIVNSFALGQMIKQFVYVTLITTNKFNHSMDSNSVNCVKFSSYHYHNHRQNVICFSSMNKTIRFWDFRHNKQLQIFKGHANSIYGIEFSQFNGGRYLCSGSYDKTIRLWDVETSKSLH